MKGNTQIDEENMSITGGVHSMGSATLVSPGPRKNIKNPAISSNTKRVANVSKKIENVEYLIKIEQKNKKQMDEKYNKAVQKLENQINKLEKELENTLKELNEKEIKIFEIQKNKLETFRLEIVKYENVYKEIEQKYQTISIEIKDSKIEENVLYNHSNMVLEDYLSYNQEIVMLKKMILDLKETLNEIEKTYPKQFQFLLEDINLEKELNEMVSQKKQHQEEVDNLEKNRKQLLKVKEIKGIEMTNLIDEMKRIEASTENSRNDSHLVKLENYIIKNINDLIVFDKMKILVQNYYNQKNFDMENELNVILIKNLNEKLKEMKNEFVLIKNEKMISKGKLEKSIEDSYKLMNVNRNESEKSKIEKEVQKKQIELERLNNEINILELNCKKKETLFNKYIIVLRNKCKKSAQESYYEMNPSLIIETEFEEKYLEEIIKIIEKDTNFTEEDKIKNKNLIEIYFKELSNREKILQNCIIKKKKIEENIENLNKDIEKVEESLLNCESEINNKKNLINDLLRKEKFYYEKIQTRNRSLTGNLQQMGELEFENYLKLNDDILKNMKKIYGNKVLDKVYKVQKQKFMENVIMNHSFKKGKVNEHIQQVTKYESVLNFLNANINELENNYKQMMRKVENFMVLKDSKLKEKLVLEESKSDLREKMEMILQSQLKEIEIDKKQLHFKFNINYYIEKITELSNKISDLNDEKEKITNEYENLIKVLAEKEQKLYIEDLDLKNNLISLSMGVNEENNPITIMPYKVNMNKSYDSTGKKEYGSSTNQPHINNEIEEKEEILVDFQDMMKKSMNEYILKSDVEQVIPEENDKNEDEMKNSVTSSKNPYKSDPFLSLTIEKIKPLVSGISLYKKFNNNSLAGKVFDPLKANENPPESCGYALRIFKINISEEVLEIRNPKNKYLESKINLSNLKGMLLNSVSKNIIKSKKSASIKPNQEIKKLIDSDHVPLVLLHDNGKIDIIAPFYQTFIILEAALDEILKNKKNLNGILKNLEN